MMAARRRRPARRAPAGRACGCWRRLRAAGAAAPMAAALLPARRRAGRRRGIGGLPVLAARRGGAAPALAAAAACCRPGSTSAVGRFGAALRPRLAARAASSAALIAARAEFIAGAGAAARRWRRGCGGAACWTGAAGGRRQVQARPRRGWPRRPMRRVPAALARAAPARQLRAAAGPAGATPSAPPLPGRKASMRSSVMVKPAYSSGARPISLRPWTAIW